MRIRIQGAEPKQAHADPEPSCKVDYYRYVLCQCCRSGIQCLFDPLDMGSDMGRKSGSGSGIRIRDDTTRIIFPRAQKPFFWVKILKFFDADPGSGMEKFGSGMGKSRIRDPVEKSQIRNTVTVPRRKYNLQYFKGTYTRMRIFLAPILNFVLFHS